ncbi:hypothetical protein PR003_g27775, partial [Phytophthora rubi]
MERERVSASVTRRLAGLMEVSVTSEADPDEETKSADQDSATEAEGATPESMQTAIDAEMNAGDVKVGKPMLIKAWDATRNNAADEEAGRWRRKRQRRLDHTKARRDRRDERQRLAATAVAQGVAGSVTSRREGGGERVEGLAEGVANEQDIGMPEPSPKFEEAIDWSARAARALREVKARRQELEDGYVDLAIAEARRQEELAAGNAVGEFTTREGVARQLVTAAAGLEAIGEAGVAHGDTTALQRTRARRRSERRGRKARAKELRELREMLERSRRPNGGYYRMDGECRRGRHNAARVLSLEEAEAIGIALPSATKVLRSRGKRRVTKQYDYHSGSVYAHPRVEQGDDGRQPRRVGQLRAVHAQTVESLPTARVEVKGKDERIKLDTGAQFSVAGEAWKELGERQEMLPPVDYVEGFTGAVSKVLGVWRFRMRTQYGQYMEVDALIIEGATTEFLLGEDWMLSHGVKIDFVSCEMKWYDGDVKKVVPFACTRTGQPDDQPAKVRLVRRARMQTQTCRNVGVAVAAPEGAVGVFMPRPRTKANLLLAPTLTTVRGGKIVVPVLNLIGATTKLPSREVLGTWAPTSDDMTVMELDGELTNAKVKRWLDEKFGEAKPLSNEGELRMGHMGTEDKELFLQLLRQYPALLERRTGCPPATTLPVEHEIHTGNEPPIKVRPRRYAQSEHGVIDGE